MPCLRRHYAQWGILNIILLNGIFLTCFRHDAGKEERLTQYVASAVFTLIYVVEAALLISAAGFNLYW